MATPTPTPTPLATRATTAWLWFFGLGAAASVPLYVLRPAETLRVFGGVVSSTAQAWVRVVGSGDALAAYVAICAATTPSARFRRVCLRGVGLYAVLHGGAFLRMHFDGHAAPSTAHLVSTWLMVAQGVLALVFA